MIDFNTFLLILLSCSETDLGLNETVFCLFVKNGLNRTKILHRFFTKRKSDEYFIKYKNLGYITNNIISGEEQEYVIIWNNTEAVSFFQQLESKITNLTKLKKPF